MSNVSDQISAAEFGRLLAASPAPHVVDVRTPAEFAECHVEGARLAPLDALDPSKVMEALRPAEGARIFLLCKAGTRAGKAAEKFRAAGLANVCVVEGGTDACVAAGLPVQRGKKTISLDGQIRIVTGAIILAGWFLARWVHPAFTYVVLFMGAGLIFSGVSGFCGLAILLGKAPWNQRADLESCRLC